MRIHGMQDGASAQPSSYRFSSRRASKADAELADPAMAELQHDLRVRHAGLEELDAFVGPHGHVIADAPLVYRAPTLSGE